MITVTAKLDDAGLPEVPVRITITASLGELELYYKYVQPNYAVGHRLHDAIGELLHSLRKVVEQGIEVGKP